MKTLVVGASENPERYAYLAILRLRKYNIPVEAIGLRPGKVQDVTIQTGKPQLTDIHTITLYINPKRQTEYYDYFLSLKPKRVIFNPGTENAELEGILQNAGIETTEACTLVMLSTKQYI